MQCGLSRSVSDSDKLPNMCLLAVPPVSDAASPTDIAHLHIWDYIAMLSEDARNAVDHGEDWVESAADNSWIKPG